MNTLTLLTIVALFFLFALAWHDESARNERKAEQSDRQPSIKTVPRKNQSAAAAPESPKLRNA